MAKSREAFRTISEVADWLDVQTHVLRFWESKFSQVKPVKRAGGRRYYRPQDMELLGGLKKLLHEDGMPIKEAQQLLREKGVKHVSSLSRPVDEEAQPVEAVAEDVTEETGLEPVETPQEEPQAGIPQDEPPEVEAELEEPVEAVDADLEDPPEADAPLEDVANQENIAVQEETVEEASEETLYTAPDDFKPDVETSVGDVEEEDNAGIPEDLLVKIEDDVPAASSKTGPLPSGLTSPAQAPEVDQAEPATAAESEQAPKVETGASSGGPEELPPMDDLFATLDTPVAPVEAEAEDAAQSTSDNTTEAEPLGELASSDAASPAPFQSPDVSAEPETPAPNAAFVPGLETMADGDNGTTPSALAMSDASDEPAINSESSVEAPTTNAPSSSGAAAPKSAPPPQAPTETANDLSAISPSSAPDLETLVARETARDDFLLMLTKPVTVDRKDASRAADLLARLEALHGKAG
ncbi:MerR family transcriptional regulator [uncultured Shimia sp.]|uniref:MerR family transcriptional regulator n=1 Tax=uncultured Shimia sp. TaxID=573152 RepID=UPI002635B449|nr:MerR family transcriptional regulator [uncultured Shimia sp.]